MNEFLAAVGVDGEGICANSVDHGVYVGDLNANLPLVGAYAAKTGAIIVKPDATLVEVDATLVEVDATLVEVDATLVEVDATLVEVDATLIEVDAKLAEVDANLVEPDATLVGDCMPLVDLDVTPVAVVAIVEAWPFSLLAECAARKV